MVEEGEIDVNVGREIELGLEYQEAGLSRHLFM